MKVSLLSRLLVHSEADMKHNFLLRLRYGSILVIVSICINNASGHGRLMSPPARNAMWRFGFPNPVNYNDNEVFCGGFGVHYDKNGGKCGVCGDDYSQSPRDHEVGGQFANGIIGERYIMGQRMPVEIELTTNHKGYFTMKLCPVNDKTKEATEECFDKYPLYLADDVSKDRFDIPEETPKSATFKYDVLLPPGLICQQCVVQWTYVTGNTWGKCPNGTEEIGCGVQETFRNCADISIYSIVAGFPPNAIDFPNTIYIRDYNFQGGRRPLVVRSQICLPVDGADQSLEMADWCQRNCLKYPPDCPREKCTCLNDCKAIGRLEGVPGTDVYCHVRCLRYPSTCPKDECLCTEISEDDTTEASGSGDGALESEDELLIIAEAST